eukprot:3227851-Amphidinium_carterae.1
MQHNHYSTACCQPSCALVGMRTDEQDFRNALMELEAGVAMRTVQMSGFAHPANEKWGFVGAGLDGAQRSHPVG